MLGFSELRVFLVGSCLFVPSYTVSSPVFELFEGFLVFFLQGLVPHADWLESLKHQMKRCSSELEARTLNFAGTQFAC